MRVTNSIYTCGNCNYTGSIICFTNSLPFAPTPLISVRRRPFEARLDSEWGASPFGTSVVGPGARFPNLCSASDDFLTSSSVQGSTRIEVPFHLRPEWWWDLDLGLSVWGFLLRGFHRRTSRLSCCNNNNSCTLINNCWEDWKLLNLKLIYLRWRKSVTHCCVFM